jgi:hypothetical protein
MLIRLESMSRVSAEAFGEFRRYHLLRGLSLEFNGVEGIVQGGPSLVEHYPVPAGPTEEFRPGDAFAACVDKIESVLGTHVVATAPRFEAAKVEEIRALTARQRDSGDSIETLFRTGSRCITASWLAEELLSCMNSLEFESQRKALPEGGADESFTERELCASLLDAVRAGQLAPEGLTESFSAARSEGLRIEQAFFLSTLVHLEESVRGSLLRASHHFSQMTRAIHAANQTCGADPMQKWTGGAADLRTETIHRNAIADRVADEFASSVLAAYSALDILRKLFDYLTRAPFGQPQLPRQRHFSSSLAARIQPKHQEQMPSALPNVSPRHFHALYSLRNDIIHNHAQDELRAALYVGMGLGPVVFHPLQYAQYLTRDVTAEGEGVLHPLCWSFYTQQRDAQAVLYAWLCEVWQTAFDTVRWLEEHVRSVARGAVNRSGTQDNCG